MNIKCFIKYLKNDKLSAIFSLMMITFKIHRGVNP